MAEECAHFYRNRACSIIASYFGGFLLLPVLAGCDRGAASPPSSTTPPATALRPGQLRISPAELFNDETRILGPHLGLTTGAVKIEYNGPKRSISVGYEIWRDGQIIHGVVGGETTYGLSGPLADTLSVSIQDVSDYTDTPNYRVVLALNDYGSGSRLLAKPSTANTSASPEALRRQVVISDDQECAVWGYMVREIGLQNVGGSISDRAKRVQWALVVKVKAGGFVAP